jgi:CXXX repeat radical SAM target protein
MKQDELKTMEPADTSSNGTKKMDRREFLAAAGKIVIPTIGILGLSLISPAGKARADDCSDCSGSCKGSCFAACNGSCSGTCYGSSQ